MTEKYFAKFPVIKYDNNKVVNITERATILNTIYQNPYLYYPYDIKVGERPDNIADKYYGDQYMSWVLYMSNKIQDPYYEWYIDQDSFNDFITKKYGSIKKAMTKTTFYRNNWYDNQNNIDTNSFNILSDKIKRFYEPIYADSQYNIVLLGYRRKQIDWKLNTNSIVKYSVTNGAFINNEIVNVWFSSNYTGTGQVCSSNSSSVFIQHVKNYVANQTITGSSYLYGTESNSNVIFTSASYISNNIPSGEATYWSPVTYYDFETEINEKNKSIRILDKNYSMQISDQLSKIL